MITLRHYQAGCSPAVIKYMKRNKGKNPLVALPTGSGKTYCIADLIKTFRSRWNTKVLVLSHVKEILEQNHASLSTYLDEKIGLNSAGLGLRQSKDITVAGIQSVYRQASLFSEHKLIIVDEAHLISPNENTMYQKFFREHGNGIIVGFTATPFRLGDGYIYGPGALFDDLVYDWTSRDRFQQLVDEGYLAKLTTKRTKLEMDTSGINLKGGDFNEKQLSERFDRKAVTTEAIKEILAAGRTRKKWLIFAIDIAHAEHIAETLIRAGIKTAPVHSTMAVSGFDRNKVLKEFKNGRYQCVVNVNILTTGFDEPGIDLIAMLRPTKSPVLHVQSFGRGSRVSPDKDNSLILDFAGNTARLGPINDVVVKVKGKGKGGGEPITKFCPVCHTIVAIAVKKCPDCEYQFSFQHHLSSNAIDLDIIESGKSRWVRVDKVTYKKHTKPGMSIIGQPATVEVSYHSGGQIYNEWICIEHKGFAKHKADHWVKYRGGSQCNTAEELVMVSGNLKTPTSILVQKNGNHKIIKDASFE